jgi:hypothetical protein
MPIKALVSYSEKIFLKRASAELGVVVKMKDLIVNVAGRMCKKSNKKK